MQIEVPDSVIDVLRDALTPIIDQLITERVEQRRPLLLSVSQVAEELSCSRASVFGLIHGGHLEAIRIARGYRVATATLQDYVEELTKPVYQREIVSARSRTPSPPRVAKNADRRSPPSTPAPTVLPATKPPRPPRQKQTKVSKEEIAESRCTIEELADRWWGLDSATALVERAGVDLVDGPDGRRTFRYGDLLEWNERTPGAFEQWAGSSTPC